MASLIGFGSTRATKPFPDTWNSSASSLPTCFSWAIPNPTRISTASFAPSPRPVATASSMQTWFVREPATAATSRSGSAPSSSGVQDSVKLLGHVDDEALPSLYRGAKLFLYPTLYEGFGLPVLEAMASGTPVLTSNNSALKEIAGGYARLVEPVDVDDIARAMLELMGDEQELDRLSQLGLERAEDLRWETTAQRTLDTYRSVLES